MAYLLLFLRANVWIHSCLLYTSYDLGRPINEDADVVLYKWDDEEGKHAFWHTSAHLLAEAWQELYPGIQFGIGPAIENGFYYDVEPGEARGV